MSTALVPVATTTRSDRFLARVAALTPSEWGRLDAIGARLASPGVVGRLHQATFMARSTNASVAGARVPAALRWPIVGVTSGVLALAELARDAADVLAGQSPDGVRWRRTRAPSVRSGDSDVARAAGRYESLFDMIDSQPGGARSAGFVLVSAMSALETEAWAARRAAAGGATSGGRSGGVPVGYAPVDPVIPYASL